MSGERFVICQDGRVLTSGYEIGRVHYHPNITSTHKPGRWFAVTANGIIGLHSQRDRAALQVIREDYPDATLLQIDYQPEEETA
jgi:hypothetical protein